MGLLDRINQNIRNFALDLQIALNILLQIDLIIRIYRTNYLWMTKHILQMFDMQRHHVPSKTNLVRGSSIPISPINDLKKYL